MGYQAVSTRRVSRGILRGGDLTGLVLGHIRFSEPDLPAAFVNIKNPPGKIPVAAGQDSLEDYCLEAV